MFIDKTVIEAKPRLLKAGWSIELKDIILFQHNDNSLLLWYDTIYLINKEILKEIKNQKSLYFETLEQWYRYSKMKNKFKPEF